jgi:hypothetical protein
VSKYKVKDNPAYRRLGDLTFLASPSPYLTRWTMIATSRPSRRHWQALLDVIP